MQNAYSGFAEAFRPVYPKLEALMNFRTIESPAEISRFLERFNFYVGVRLSEEYAKQGFITGLYDENDLLVGGYMIITQPNFRILGMVPDVVKRAHPFFKEASPSDIVEVNGVWLARKATRGNTPKTFWLRILDDVIKCKKNYLLIMADARNQSVQRVHQDLRPTLIFKGSPELQAGVTSHKEIVVSYAKRSNLILGKYFRRFYAPSILKRTPVVRWINRQLKPLRT